MDDSRIATNRDTSEPRTENAREAAPETPAVSADHVNSSGSPSVTDTSTADSELAPPVVARRPLVVRVFIGPTGLRAGWRLLIYVVLVALVGAAIARGMRAIGHAHRPTGEITAWTVVVGDSILFAIVLIPSLIMGAFEKRSLADYFLPVRRAFGRRFWEGAAWGFVALTVLLAGMRATGDFYFGQPELHGTRLLYFAAVWGLAFIMVGLAEEYALRGYSMYTLASGIGFWPAALILSIVFAWLHRGNPGETALGLIDVVAIALFFCLTLRITGNLWFAIGYHAAWDWGETFFYGVPNSGMSASGHLLSPQIHGSWWITGGTAGPEGSLFSIVLTCVVAALFAARFRKRTSF